MQVPVAALTLSVTTLDVPEDVPNAESKEITKSVCSSLPPKLLAAIENEKKNREIKLSKIIEKNNS